METSGYLYKETISRSSLSDDGKSSIKKYGIDSESCADVKGSTLHCFCPFLNQYDSIFLVLNVFNFTESTNTLK